MKKHSVSKRSDIAEAFKKLRALSYIPKKHLDFMEAVTKAHAKAKDRIAEDNVYPTVTKKTADKMLSEGFPVISVEKIRAKVRPMRAHLKEICAILTQFGQSQSGAVEDFSQSALFKKLDVKTFVAKTVSQNGNYLKGLSAETGADENILKFMAITLARPLFEVAAAQVNDVINQDFWWKNACPACGSEPFMAMIRKKDNMRVLGCSLCGTEWKFDRVTCPFCDNKDQRTMRFFYFHEESPHRLYVCDKCKRYIKCVDLRKIELGKEINLTLEDMATLYLDTLAREKGYVSGWSLKEKDNDESIPE